MKLPLLVLAVCTVGKGTIHSSKLMDFEYYWRDWDVNSPIPDDAVAGGVDANGHTTYVARSVLNNYGILIPGQASPQAKKMWFEGFGREHTKTKDVEILCVLNQLRLKWVAVNSGDTVEKIVGDNILIYCGSSRSRDTSFTIGRQRIGNEILVGNLDHRRGKFDALYTCQNGRSLKVCSNGIEVLLYVTDDT